MSATATQRLGLLVSAVLAVAWATADTAPPAPSDSSAVALRVNGEPVAVGELTELFHASLVRQRAFGPQTDAELRGQAEQSCADAAVRGAVTRALVRQEAGRRRLTLTDAEVLAGRAAEQARAGGAAAWQTRLQQEGLTAEAYDRSLRDRLLQKALTKAISHEPLTEAEARQYYRDHSDRFSERMLGSQKKQVMPFEDVRDRCELQARARKRQYGYLDWLRLAAAGAVIEPKADVVRDEILGVSAPLHPPRVAAGAGQPGAAR